MDPVAFVKNFKQQFNLLLRDIIDGRAKDYQANALAALYVCCIAVLGKRAVGTFLSISFLLIFSF